LGAAKQIEVKPISASHAREVIRALHYSGKVAPNSQLHFGVFLAGYCGGALQFGPPTVKRNVLGLVSGTSWNGMLELNRMALAEWLPKNGESRAIAMALKLIRRNYPQVEWILSFADGTQCGDGTIYRAAGFVPTQINASASTLARLPDGEVIHDIACKTGVRKAHMLKTTGGAASFQKYVKAIGGEYLSGCQFRYIYFLTPAARARLTVPVIPFAEIARRGVGMYRGEKRVRSETSDTSATHVEEGGATPTRTLA